MTLPEALTEFESRFKEASVGPDVRSELSLVCSGGVVPHDAVLPALYSSADLAVPAWLKAATSHVPKGHVKLEWIIKPELLEFQITMADKKQQHRLVANRFAVKSQFKTSK